MKIEYDKMGECIDERNRYFTELLESNVEHINSTVRGVISKNGSFESNGMLSNIEKMGTALLKSKDVATCRQIDNSFFETERDYRSRYEIGKNTIAVDFTLEENDMSNGFSGFGSLTAIDMASDELKKAFYIHDKQPQEVERIIDIIEKYKRKDWKSQSLSRLWLEKLKELDAYISSLILNEMDEKNYRHYKYITEGLDNAEIASRLNVSERTVYRRKDKIINFLCNKTKK